MSDLNSATHMAIEQALARRDIAAAASLAQQAAASGVRDPLILNLLAWQKEEDGDFAGARALLDEALVQAPGDALILGAIGAVLRKQGHLREALTTLDRAIAAEPQVASFWLERAMALEAGGALAAAQQSYERAAQLDPASASAFGGAALIAAQQGERDQARAHAARALAIDPADPLAATAMAKIETEAGRPDQAISQLEPLLGDPPADQRNRAMIFSAAGDAFDKAGRVDEAFAAYEQANAASRARFEQLLNASGGALDHRGMAERLVAEFGEIGASHWRTNAPKPQRAPVFLIGYPRSGTTLLENVLASAASVQALEERPTLAAGDGYLKQPGGLARLAALDEDQLGKLRDAYWQAASSAGAADPAKLLVDMDPLKGLKLPLIAKLFPGARIILMRRDPRDVVWSCFRSNFAPSPAALEHTSLARAAAHYDAMMRAQDLFLGTLPCVVHEVRYEELVRNFDEVTAALCAFLGIEWSPQLREFASTAKRRGVTTMSAAQVRKGLYDGSQQWRRYEQWLQPVLPALRPWVERYGYRP